MGQIGCGFSIAAGAFAMLAVIPLLGWLNWFTTLPFAALAIVFGIFGMRSEQERRVAALAVIFGCVLLGWGVFRLILGGGLV